MNFLYKKTVFFDAASCTPINKESYKEMKKILKIQTTYKIGNPAAFHSAGINATKYIAEAKKMISSILNVKKENVFFTSGATEGNMIVIRSILLNRFKEGVPFNEMNILLGEKEHDSVKRAAGMFKVLGVKVILIPMSKNGIISPKDVISFINNKTILVSIQAVDSETGVRNPIRKISNRIKQIKKDIFFHTDASQAAAYFSVNLESLGVDAITIGSTKLFGPQGVGLVAFIKLNSLTGISGENTSWDIRPGTPSIILIAGFKKAFEYIFKNKEEILKNLKKIQLEIINGLKKEFPNSYIFTFSSTSSKVEEKMIGESAPHILYVSFGNDIDHLYLASLLEADNVLVNTGVACNRQFEGENKEKGIRISYLPSTTKRDVKILIKAIKNNIYLAKPLE